jgi:hypothetical protein
LDKEVEEMRKSAPLFRDLSGSWSTVVRAKYMHDKVDAKSIAMQMLRDGTETSIQKLVEFTLCRQAVGRGGEHVFLRWAEACCDDYYHAVDFDWSVIKQKDV